LIQEKKKLNIEAKIKEMKRQLNKYIEQKEKMIREEY
jgi:hypothetical protein